MSDIAASVLVFATAVANLAVAIYAGREAARKAKEGAGVLKEIEARTKLSVSEVTAEVGNLTHEVAGLSQGIVKEFRMFNERFKDAQEHLTLVLTAMVGDDPSVAKKAP